MTDRRFLDLILSRRTVRRFKAEPVPRDLLVRIVDAGRLAPSAANLQPLEFVVVDDAAVRARIFPCLRWAAYIAPAGNPPAGEEPAAYVVTLANTAVRDKGHEYDAGAAVENMILAAWSEGVASCWMISIDKDKIREALAIPETHAVDNVLALGYPAESPRAEVYSSSPRYWKDETGRLHVPKRPLESVLHVNGFARRG